MKTNQKTIGLFFILCISIIVNLNAQSPLLIAVDVGAPCGSGILQSGTQNGKAFYGSGVHTVAWSGTQWEWSVSGVLYATNSANTEFLAPCSAAFSWTLTPTGSSTCGIDNPNLEVRGSNCTSLVLPVELLSFFGQELSGSIQLFWETATGINNEKFEIEESQSGREFQKIGEVMGMGITVDQQDYSFEIKGPKKGISYYRLKQMDFDGKVEYSHVISVNVKGESKEVGEFYPNPSKSGLVNLVYSSQDDDEIKVAVFDMTGMLMTKQIKQVSAGSNNLSFDFSDMDIGVYIAKIGNERNPTRRKLIINK